MTSFTVGRYYVHLLEKPGPGCALYAVYLGHTKIGQCISLPGESDCAYLERQQREQTGYAYSREPLPELTGRRRENTGGIGPAMARWEGHQARNRKIGAPRKPKTLQDIAKALAGG